MVQEYSLTFFTNDSNYYYDPETFVDGDFELDGLAHAAAGGVAGCGVGFWLEPEPLATGTPLLSPPASLASSVSAQEDFADLLAEWENSEVSPITGDFMEALQPTTNKNPITKPTLVEHLADANESGTQATVQKNTMVVHAPPLKMTPLTVPSLPALSRKRTISKSQYRRDVAIPLFLEKRKHRKWERGLMHPSRSDAARRRARNGGQFRLTDTRFVPCTELHASVPSSEQETRAPGSGSA